MPLSRTSTSTSNYSSISSLHGDKVRLVYHRNPDKHTHRRSNDKFQSCSIITTPPSPAVSPPPLTQSTSFSTSMSSTPQPFTPPRGRTSSRYPDTLGRVPLHRRGTSQTYERLEDLLREAGYKETRIFTPEGEHAESEAADNASMAKTSMRGVGAVVGFLAGLMPNVTSRNSSLHRNSTHENADHVSGTQSDVPRTREERGYSPPVSPLTHRKQHPRRLTRRAGVNSSMTSTTTTGSSTENLQNLQMTPSSRPSTSSTSTARPQKRLHHQRAHLKETHQLQHQTSNTSLAATHLSSFLGNYIRHMSSEPHIPLSQGPNVHSDDTDDQPPLPSTWLENVARAVLFGGAGAHFGGPHSSLERVSKSSRPALRPTRSSISQPVGKTCASAIFSDYTNSNRVRLHSPLQRATALLAPPPLCARMLTERARTSEGKVSRTAVVCRSAPVSRSGSRVRGAGKGVRARWLKGEELKDALGITLDGDGREKRRRYARRKEKERKRPKDGVPSLARTRVEGDVWSPVTGDGENKMPGGRTGSGSGSGEDYRGDEDDDDDNDGEDEGPSSSEGELDLARMLVPPKRQNSIRSLRKHLHVDRGNIGRLRVKGLLASRSGTTTPAWTDREEEGGEEGWGRGWRRKRGRKQWVDEDEEGYRAAGFLSAGEGSMSGGSTAMGKRRRGIPGVWVGW
jgi:hypothetical protein